MTPTSSTFSIARRLSLTNSNPAHSERTLVDGKESVQNHFVVEGNYKYKYNNSYIAMSDTHAACMNFVNALEKMPGIITQYEERTAKLKADVPQLEAIISKTWGKEGNLVIKHPNEIIHLEAFSCCLLPLLSL